MASPSIPGPGTVDRQCTPSREAAIADLTVWHPTGDLNEVQKSAVGQQKSSDTVRTGSRHFSEVSLIPGQELTNTSFAECIGSCRSVYSRRAAETAERRRAQGESSSSSRADADHRRPFHHERVPTRCRRRVVQPLCSVTRRVSPRFALHSGRCTSAVVQSQPKPCGTASVCLLASSTAVSLGEKHAIATHTFPYLFCLRLDALIRQFKTISTLCVSGSRSLRAQEAQEQIFLLSQRLGEFHMSTQKARDFCLHSLARSTPSCAILSHSRNIAFDLDEPYMAQMLGVIEALRSDQMKAGTSRAPTRFLQLRNRRSRIPLFPQVSPAAFPPLPNHDIDGARRHRQPRKGFARSVPQQRTAVRGFRRVHHLHCRRGAASVAQRSVGL